MTNQSLHASWPKQAAYFFGALVLPPFIILAPFLLGLAGFYGSGYLFGRQATPTGIFAITTLVGLVLSVGVSILTPLILPFYVYNDAKKLKAGGADMWAPEIWWAIMFLSWIPGFAFYLTMRKFNYFAPPTAAS